MRTIGDASPDVKRRIGKAVAFLLVIAVVMIMSESTVLASQIPIWKITSVTTPTKLVAGSSGSEVQVSVTNVGGAAAKGNSKPINLEDTLPTGFEVTEGFGFDMYAAKGAFNGLGFAGEITCGSPKTLSPSLVCEYGGEVLPGDTIMLTIVGNVSAGGLATGADSEVTIEGGGASASVNVPLTSGDTPAEYEIAPGSFVVEPSSLQAGAHPDLTTSFALSTTAVDGPAANPRDLRFDLPTGLVGNASRLPSCPIAQAIRFACPTAAIVGVATATIEEFGTTLSFTIPVYNVRPLAGEPAAFEFTAQFLAIRLDTSVLPNGEYRVRVAASDLTELATLMASSVTLWGVPADHNGPGPVGFTFEAEAVPSVGGVDTAVDRVPLLTNPTQCTRTLEASMETDSWANPNPEKWPSQSTTIGAMEGCERLSFGPSFKMVPDKLQPGTPAGYTFDLAAPQGEEPDGLAPPDVKNVSLTLPAGVVTSPSVASGLASCSDALFGLHSGTPNACSSDAQIGEVEVTTPALPNPLKGQVYIGEPECNPCSPTDAKGGRMVRLFLQVLGEGEDGVLVKLEGKGRIDESTGQVTTVFENNPQLPFSELKLTLKGGPRAPLANPRTCGAVESALDVTPWSTPMTPDVQVASGFSVNENCFGPQFAPSFTAGTTNNQAAGFSPFTLAFGRQDSDQYLSGVQVKMPPGLLGKLSAVPLCKEPQAAAGTCGAESRIGHVRAQVGPGAEPFLVEGGEVFLTEGYKGAPFGLSILVPTKAGPYTLSGKTGRGEDLVRAAISVDPNTSQITITSDPLPAVEDGIPLQVRAVQVAVDREGFMFNPTNCEAQTITGTLTSEQGMQAGVSTHFQAANCATLPFKPKFTASSKAQTSRSGGASLDVKVGYPAGTQANIRSVKVSLPKQLPSRLKTIQQACPEATFAANPASCPAASNIGTAKAVTPVLSVPLLGPAYLVSHGGAAFPDLVVILQGEGVRVDLTGSIFISKGGITSSTFGSVPDVPISSFELTLPRGTHSALTVNLPKKAKGKICGQKLAMPTTITGQNGAQITQSTKIAITGCPKAKKAKKHGKKAGKGKK